jgi:hypothetical protein
MGALAQIPLSPPLSSRLIALIVCEAVLIVVVVAAYLRYRQLKSVSVDDWFAERDEHASPRVRRMMDESHAQWEVEQRIAAEAEGRSAGTTEPPPGTTELPGPPAESPPGPSA